MIRAKKLVIPRVDDIRNEVIHSIISNLGITKAAFFLRESMSQKTDYLQIKDGLFGKKKGKKIYSELKKETKC